MRRKLLGAFCIVILRGSAVVGAQPFPERKNPAFDQLRGGVWEQTGAADSFEPARSGASEAGPESRGSRLLAVGWQAPQLTSPLPEVPRAPVPREVKPVEAARAVEPVRAVAAAARPSACEALRKKAKALRDSAFLCDRDIANGHSYSNVEVTFDTPRIPRTLNAREARSYAGQFESVADQRNEIVCAQFGEPGFNPANEPSRVRADAYYRRLCAAGDQYACNARQIEELCFNTSPMNSCVRNCLVTQDEKCLAASASNPLDCRIYAHFQCYASCGKVMPNIPEGFCVYQLPGWRSVH